MPDGIYSGQRPPAIDAIPAQTFRANRTFLDGQWLAQEKQALRVYTLGRRMVDLPVRESRLEGEGDPYALWNFALFSIPAASNGLDWEF